MNNKKQQSVEITMNKHEVKYKGTNDRMCKALIEILKKKRIESITVKEFCDVAEINRSTFYAHFDAISDLLIATKEYIRNQCRQEISALFDEKMIDLKDKFNDNTIRQYYLYPYLEALKNHRDIFIIPEFSNLSEIFEYNREKIMEMIFLPKYKDLGKPEQVIQMKSVFFFAGVDAVISKWLKDDCQLSAEFIGDIIRDCVLSKK